MGRKWPQSRKKANASIDTYNTYILSYIARLVGIVGPRMMTYIAGKMRKATATTL